MLDKTCTAYFFDFRADAYIFVICSNSVEQLRFWCRAVLRADEFQADDPSPENHRKEEKDIDISAVFDHLNLPDLPLIHTF